MKKTYNIFTILLILISLTIIINSIFVRDEQYKIIINISMLILIIFMGITALLIRFINNKKAKWLKEQKLNQFHGRVLAHFIA